MAAPTADGVPYCVSQYGCGDREGEHPDHAELAPRSVYGRRHEKCLAGRGNAEAFDEYGEKEGGIAVSDQEGLGLGEAPFQMIDNLVMGRTGGARFFGA